MPPTFVTLTIFLLDSAVLDSVLGLQRARKLKKYVLNKNGMSSICYPADVIPRRFLWKGLI